MILTRCGTRTNILVFIIDMVVFVFGHVWSLIVRLNFRG
jgi:hypothetical protein